MIHAFLDVFFTSFFTSESLQVSANKSGAQPFGVFTLGDTSMKKVLCAADATRGNRGVDRLSASVRRDLDWAGTGRPGGRDGPRRPTTHPRRPKAANWKEIVVTAEKRESTVQATPISITALSATDLAQEKHRDRGGSGRQRCPAYRCAPRVPVRPSMRCEGLSSGRRYRGDGRFLHR